MKTAGQPADYMDGDALHKYIKAQNEITRAALLKAGLIKQ
jgi:hypothetical protein